MVIICAVITLALLAWDTTIGLGRTSEGNEFHPDIPVLVATRDDVQVLPLSQQV